MANAQGQIHRRSALLTHKSPGFANLLLMNPLSLPNEPGHGPLLVRRKGGRARARKRAREGEIIFDRGACFHRASSGGASRKLKCCENFAYIYNPSTCSSSLITQSDAGDLGVSYEAKVDHPLGCRSKLRHQTRRCVKNLPVAPNDATVTF